MSDRVYCLTRVYGSDYERVVCALWTPAHALHLDKVELQSCNLYGVSYRCTHMYAS